MTLRFFVFVLVTGVLSSLATAPPSPAPSASIAPPIEFDQFILVLLLRPPNAPELPKPELEQLQEGHMANIRRLHADGKLLKAGPTEDQSGRNVRGIFILMAIAGFDRLQQFGDRLSLIALRAVGRFQFGKPSATVASRGRVSSRGPRMRLPFWAHFVRPAT